MSKADWSIEKAERRAIRAGRRGWTQCEKDSSGKVISRTTVYACHCLSRGLMSDRDICPAHRSSIGSHKARTQNLGLRR